MTTSRFTEADTEALYDRQERDRHFRSFWDPEGSLHWGYFDNLAGARAKDFIPACQRWSDYMLEQSGITAKSRVLEIGCGNGNTAIWLAQQTGCEVVGVDISQNMLNNALQKARSYPNLRLSFLKESATNLSFKDASFTHVWSQAALYNIHDRDSVLAEIHRVLEEQGILLFDDLVSPTPNISEVTRKHVYNRLLFEPSVSADLYTEKLKQLGLMVLQFKDLSEHLAKSYELAVEIAQEQHPEISSAFEKMQDAIAVRELGWCFYLCQKVSNPRSWIYESQDSQSLQKKYDAFAANYETELGSYRNFPIQVASILAEVLPNTEVSILDAGMGTGMVGEALARLGYTNITGTDLSEGMLEIGRKKQVYKALYQGNLEYPLDFATPETFDAIISVGVFTFGHAPPEGIQNLFPLLKSGGYFVFTVRVDYYDSQEVLREILDSLSWSLIKREESKVFETESMYAFVFKKH